MCTMNAELTSGQRLMAESQHMSVEVKVAADKLDRLELENSKLRELAAHLWRHSDFCKDCALAEECGMTTDLPWKCQTRQAYRDLQGLGIEVDE